jgi:hypothetical protein
MQERLHAAIRSKRRGIKLLLHPNHPITVMNPTPATPTPARRSYARWIIAGLVLLIAPIFLVAAGVLSLLTLDRDAALLRREVMTATGSDWHTKVQMNLGWGTLGTVRTILRFVEHKDIADARLALKAVRSASVGVYERTSYDDDADMSQMLVHTDKMMEKRGWSRLVGVVDGRQTVLIYTSDVAMSGDRIDLCLAVVDGRELVVVSTRVDAGTLGELVERHAPGGIREKLKFASL